MYHVQDLGIHSSGHGFLAVLDEVGHQNGYLDCAGGGEGHVRFNSDLLTLINRKVNLLSVLQVNHIDADCPVEAGGGYHLFHQNLEVLYRRAGSGGVLE